MERRGGLRPISAGDREWWTSVEEGYWQALLRDGEIAPEVVPPSDAQDTFSILGLELEPSSESDPAAQGNGGPAGDEWHTARCAMDCGEVFCLKVSGANRGGLLVGWNGLQGFVPASHLLDGPHHTDPHVRMLELSGRIGDTLTVRLIEVDEEQRRLVFSERAAQSGSKSATAILNALCPGDSCQGKVTNLTTFGAFVDLGGIEGLIHISELSWDRVRHPADVLRPGQEVEVYVLGISPEEKRIALSLKQLRPDPWKDLESRYQVGETVEGTVTNVVSFGAFVRLEEGLEGLIHISELAEGTFMHPRDVVQEEDVVQVRILNIDPAQHRLGLSLRRTHNPELDG